MQVQAGAGVAAGQTVKPTTTSGMESLDGASAPVSKLVRKRRESQDDVNPTCVFIQKVPNDTEMADLPIFHIYLTVTRHRLPSSPSRLTHDSSSSHS